MPGGFPFLGLGDAPACWNSISLLWAFRIPIETGQCSAQSHVFFRSFSLTSRHDRMMVETSLKRRAWKVNCVMFEDDVRGKLFTLKLSKRSWTKLLQWTSIISMGCGWGYVNPETWGAAKLELLPGSRPLLGYVAPKNSYKIVVLGSLGLCFWFWDPPSVNWWFKVVGFEFLRDRVFIFYMY